MALDKSLFEFLNSFSQVGFLQGPLRLLVNEYFVPVTLSLILLYIWLTAKEKDKRVAVIGMLSVGLVNLLIKLINLNYFRARPFVEMNVNLLYYRPTDSSFPSNAAAVAFAIATAIWIVNKRWGYFCLAIAFVYSLARVIVGVHYPSDIFVGAILGILFSLAISKTQLVDLISKLLVRTLQRLGLEPLI